MLEDYKVNVGKNFDDFACFCELQNLGLTHSQAELISIEIKQISDNMNKEIEVMKQNEEVKYRNKLLKKVNILTYIMATVCLGVFMNLLCFYK